MAINQDVILQMIEQLAETFQQIFAGDKSDNPSQQLIALEQALSEVFRTRRELLFMRPMEMIEEFDGRLNAEVGRVFVEHARLSEELGREDDAVRSYELAMECLTRGIGVDLQVSDQNANDVLRNLLRSQIGASLLSAEEMAEVWREIFETEAKMQHFDLAEDALFHAIDLADDPTDHIKRGIRHYNTLLEFDEKRLEQVGFPVEDVQFGLDDLRAMLD